MWHAYEVMHLLRLILQYFKRADVCVVFANYNRFLVPVAS